MSVYGPSSAFILVGGRNISSDTFVLNETLENMTEEIHGLGDTYEEHLPIGIGKIALEASGGIYDDRTDGIMDALQAQGETRQIVGFGFSGQSVGADAVLLDGSYAATWQRIASRTGLTKAHAIHQINGEYIRGQIIHGLTAETTSGTTATAMDRANVTTLSSIAITSSSVANPTVITTAVDHGLTTGDVVLIESHSGATPALNGGDGYPVTVTGDDTFTIAENVTVGGTGGTFKVVSLRGGVGDLHVTNLVLGGYTSFDMIVEDSPDDSTYSTLFTFTAATGVGAERESTTDVINRYVQCTWTWTGSGSGNTCTPYVAVG